MESMPSKRIQYRGLSPREKRKDRRVLFPPLEVVVDGQTCVTNNWSFGGVLIEQFEFAGRLSPRLGDLVECSMGWENERHHFLGEVSRVDEHAGELAFRFYDINEETMMFLDRHLRRHLSAGRQG